MVDLDSIEIGQDVLGLIPKAMALERLVLPLKAEGDTVAVVLTEGYSYELIQDLEFLLGRRIEPVAAESEALEIAIRKFYHVSEAEAGSHRHSAAQVSFAEDASAAHQDGSVVSLASRIISEAIRMGASDIHIEPYEKIIRIRYRLDGVLHEVLEPPFEKAKPLISRLKILSDLDIGEKRRPQDGRMRVKHEGRSIDIRVSTLPTDFGEKLVLRILDKSAVKLDLDTLGFEEADLKVFKKTIQLPYGMVLVTGPTGSGKTTTLYAALNHINSPELNIVTIEDPIEYNLPGINQTHVRSDIGLTFAAALRSILRQDPDVIMVGEIRDKETAEIAIRAALTGHLVFSTLHTNDAPSAVTRLVDMGIEPFLVASSVKLILAQRLLRRLCPHCKQVIQPHLEELKQFAFVGDLHGLTFYKEQGCTRCDQVGFRGRIAAYESLPMRPEIVEMVAEGSPQHSIREKAQTLGLKCLASAAMEKVRSGETSLGEVERETAA